VDYIAMLHFLSLHDTHIGSGLPNHCRAKVVVSAIMLSVVVLDLLIVRLWHVETWRCTLAIVAYLTAAFAGFELGDARTFGLCISPRQGWRFWGIAACGMAIVVGALLAAISAVVFGLLEYEPPQPYSGIFADRYQIFGHLLHMCIVAPLQEEAVYRLALCVVAIVWLGPRWCVIASGLTFALLHSAYGNPSPENLVWGFLLACAFLKSSTILVPLALHAGGNLIAFTAQWVHAAWFG
jgi:membrane protease YdiL (CAAX protease family)